MQKFIKSADMTVIIITAVLFIVALFVKGLTKEILLEAGVLLVSIKIILMSHQNSRMNKELLKEIDKINQQLSSSDDKSSE